MSRGILLATKMQEGSIFVTEALSGSSEEAISLLLISGVVRKAHDLVTRHRDLEQTMTFRYVDPALCLLCRTPCTHILRMDTRWDI